MKRWNGIGRSRLRILELLAEGERCVCEIQPAVEGEQSNVSRHLAFLRSQGLIVAERQELASTIS